MHIFIDNETAQNISEFYENYWTNPEQQPENCPMWLEEKGIIKLLKQILQIWKDNKDER